MYLQDMQSVAKLFCKLVRNELKERFIDNTKWPLKSECVAMLMDPVQKGKVLKHFKKTEISSMRPSSM